MDQTKRILLEKYHPELLAELEKSIAEPEKPTGLIWIHKSMLPTPAGFSTLGEWLEHIAPKIVDWPPEIAKAVLKDFLRRHYARNPT